MGNKQDEILFGSNAPHVVGLRPAVPTASLASILRLGSLSLWRLISKSQSLQFSKSPVWAASGVADYFTLTSDLHFGAFSEIGG